MSPTHEYDGLGDYYAQLTVTNPLGCRDSAYTLVEGPVMVYIPNAFTPNNDGINDGFQVVISDVVYFEINIFNSWGEEIYYSTDPDEDLDGQCQGGRLLCSHRLVQLPLALERVTNRRGGALGHH